MRLRAKIEALERAAPPPEDPDELSRWRQQRLLDLLPDAEGLDLVIEWQTRQPGQRRFDAPTSLIKYPFRHLTDDELGARIAGRLRLADEVARRIVPDWPGRYLPSDQAVKAIRRAIAEHDARGAVPCV